MASIFKVLSSSDKVTVQDEFGNHDERFLTLGNTNPGSGNRFYVCLSGQDVQRDWQVGDCLMVELSLCAYKHGNQWHMTKCPDSIQLVEIGIVSNNNKG